MTDNAADSADFRPADFRPAESRPAESGPAESRPAESRPSDVHPAAARPADDHVHPYVRIGAAWTWRLLVLFAGVMVLGLAVARLSTVTVPLGLALLAAALLSPLVDRMDRAGLPRSIAVVVAIVSTLGIVGGIFTFVVQQAIDGLPDLSDQITASITGLQDWLTNGPLHLSDDQIRSAGDSVVSSIRANQETLTSGALTTAATIGEILTGALLMLFILIFYLYGGRQIWEFVTRIAPRPARVRVRLAGVHAFGSLVGFVRATVVVAAVDAIGIGTGLAILGVPLALPLASLVFIGAFVPIVGAVVTGFVAVIVALVTKGVFTALIALAVVVGVMQLEGHVLQPLLLGRAVRLHPLAVVLAITTGVVLGGIIGALLAVPLVAMANTAVRSLLASDPNTAFAQMNVPIARAPLFPARPDSPEKSRGTVESDSAAQPEAPHRPGEP